MGVAAHLGIELREYDRRIRTFIPDYEEMLDVAAAAVPRDARTIVDLGTGTGALAARCLERAPQARIIAIDRDREILAVAARRLGKRATFLARDFSRQPLARGDVVVASFALHHVRTRAAKARLYARLGAALTRRGSLVSVDCHPSANPETAAAQFAAWRDHLERSYTRREAAGFLRAWAREDVYVPLETELDLVRRGGLRTEVLWRRDAFAVVRARR